MEKETCARTLKAARKLKKYKEDDRLSIIYKSENGMDYISHIHYENGFIMNVRRFNLRFDGIYYHNDYNMNSMCPPDPIRIILRGLFVQKELGAHIVAFAYFCDRQAKRYASYATSHATTASAAAHAAAAASYDTSASYAASSTSAAAHAATAAASRAAKHAAAYAASSTSAAAHAAAAAYATASSASYAASASSAASASYAASSTSTAASASSAASYEQYAFLVKLLKGTKWEKERK